MSSAGSQGEGGSGGDGTIRRKRRRRLRWSSPPGRVEPVPSGWLAFFLARLPCLLLPFCPHPPAPLPGGKGENQGYFMQGAPPLASPRLSRRRHGLNLRCRCPAGGLPGRSPADVAVPESVGGACFLCCPPTLPLVYFFAPLPRRGRIDPQPPSRREGGDQKFISPGASPPAPLH